MSIPFVYSLISVGVNRSPGAVVLRYAERDAIGIACALAGQLGPVHPSNANVLLGAGATYAALDTALEAEVARQPDFFAFYFGGHGNHEGIALADRLYPFSRLRAWLNAIGARGAAVMLNSCQAGGFAKSAVAGLGEDRELNAAWGVALLAAVPGARVFMASNAVASTFEREGIGGIYAHALVNAMQATRAGDLRVWGYEFVSDSLVFQRAAAIMRRYDLTPARYGQFGGFPMVLANRDPVGDTAVTAMEALDGLGLEVSVDIHDRLYLPTKVIATATDAFGNRWPSSVEVALPVGSSQSITAEFAVDVTESRGALLQLDLYGACRITWEVAVVDANGRLLTEDRQVVDYRA